MSTSSRWLNPQDQHFDHEKMIHLKLSIGEDYDCRMINGSSNSDHAAYRFVVSPPLPDDLTGIELRFTRIGVLSTATADDDIVFKL